MKLNFWQWLGLVLVIVAGSWLIYDWVTGEPEPEGPAERPPAQVAPGDPEASPAEPSPEESLVQPSPAIPAEPVDPADVD